MDTTQNIDPLAERKTDGINSTGDSKMNRTIQGRDVTPRAGMQVVPDTWDYAKPLTECDDWAKAEFRMQKDPLRSLPALAVNVEVTGRTIRWTTGLVRPFVRVRVTFVGDCEEDQTVSGRMYLDGKG